MNEDEMAKRRAAWLQTTSREELEAFRPLTDAEVRQALDLGERERTTAEAQGNTTPDGLRAMLRW